MQQNNVQELTFELRHTRCMAGFMSRRGIHDIIVKSAMKLQQIICDLFIAFTATVQNYKHQISSTHETYWYYLFSRF